MNDVYPPNSCRQHSYKALLVTQALGALNDNLFKIVLTLLTVSVLLSNSDSILNLVLINCCFVVPFILFSSFAGSISDRFSKSSVIKVMKLAEIGIMLTAGYFIYIQEFYGLFFVLFLMGLQSTIFSPAKYGILPELLSVEHLSKGNGYLEFSTFIAIILGTASGGFVTEHYDAAPWLAGVILAMIAMIGLLASLTIKQTPVANPNCKLRLNPFATAPYFKAIAANRGLFLCLVAITYFWAIGSLYQLNLVLYAKQLAGLNDTSASLLMMSLGVGIGVGSILAGKVSEGKVELGLVPLGAVGMALSGFLLGFSYHSFYLSALLLLLSGLSAGIYVVPLSSYFQYHSPEDKRGSYLAASNLAIFSSILLSGFVLLVLIDGVGLNPAHVFMVCGVVSCLAAIYIVTVLPEVLIRCINWLLIHTIYRLRVTGINNIPSKSGALLVCNHISYIDAQLVLAAIDRPVRYLMHKPIYKTPGIHFLAKAMGCIPVEAGGDRERNIASLSAATAAIRSGELVCIFAEGGISRTGKLLKFKHGFEIIMKGLDAPIIPVYLDQVWGSIFSYKNKKFFWKWPKSIPYRAAVFFGEQLPSSSNAQKVRQAVQNLSTTAFESRAELSTSLPLEIHRSCKKNSFSTLYFDSQLKARGGVSLFAAIRQVSRTIFQQNASQRRVALALTNDDQSLAILLAAIYSGLSPIVLPLHLGPKVLQSILAEHAVERVIASDSALGSLPAEISQQVQVVAGPMQPPSSIDKLSAFMRLFCAPPTSPTSSDEIAYFVVSAGRTTGVPRTIGLTHRNVMTNVRGIFDYLDISSTDGFLSIMPPTTALGCLTSCILPILAGSKVGFQDVSQTPDRAFVHRLFRKLKPSLLPCSPYYLEKVLETLRNEMPPVSRVFCGGSALSEVVKTTWQSLSAAPIYEGYGCTELSPIALINTESFQMGDYHQPGSKDSTVGHPLPGVSVRIVDETTHTPVPYGTLGILQVKGSLVAKSVLIKGQEQDLETDEGWFTTGDHAVMDKDGFIQLP